MRDLRTQERSRYQFTRRLSWPSDKTCAGCGDAEDKHLNGYCRASSVQRAIESGTTRS